LIGVQVPRGAALILVHRLGPQLIAIAGQRADVDAGALDRPVAPVAGAVPQVFALIGSADEDRLARELRGAPGIGRPEGIARLADEAFGGFDLAVAHGL